MTFVPKPPKETQKVPYFEDANAADGWGGQTTTKSIESLQQEIMVSISRLGGMVTSFMEGTFDVDGVERDGFQIHYLITGKDGAKYPGKIEIAALPIKPVTNYRSNSSPETKREKSMKMALYMFEISLKGTWFLGQLSPGYSPLMPFMLVDEDHTVSQMWQESKAMNNLLPPGETQFKPDGENNDVVDGEFQEK